MTEYKINTISVHELKQRREADPNLCIIDVREDYEWEQVRIPGALHIPKDTLQAQIETQCPSRDQPLYLHCRGGVRSLHAAHLLHDMGYTNVYSIDGGIAEWAMVGYPVEEG